MSVAPEPHRELTGSGFSEETRRWAQEHPEDRKRLDPAICSVCAHIAKHGWTGLDGATHCRNCHAVWGGSSTIHCVTCHRTFSNDANLVRHQASYRDGADEFRVRCHDPATVRHGRDKRLYFGEPRPNAHGVPIWRKFNDREMP